MKKTIKIVKIKAHDCKTVIETHFLKEKFVLNGLEFAIVKDDCRHYPFRVYHFETGQPIGRPEKLLKHVKENFLERIQRIFMQENRWQDLLTTISGLETVN
jgi:hypothetical protein